MPTSTKTLALVMIAIAALVQLAGSRPQKPGADEEASNSETSARRISSIPNPGQETSVDFLTGQKEGTTAGAYLAEVPEESWVRRYSTGGDDKASDLAVDGSGNVYVTGSAGGDYATIKYDATGNLLWLRRYNGPGNGEDAATDIALDAAGNAYVTGRSFGTGTYMYRFDYATIKYDANGNQKWVSRYNGPANGSDGASAIVVDRLGNVCVTGGSEGGASFGDYATIKYDANGNELWVRRYNGPANRSDAAWGIAVDFSGNVLVTGTSAGVSIYSQDFDYATVKYDANGNQLWVARYDGPDEGYDVPYAIAVDGSGNSYVTGESWWLSTGIDYVTIKYGPDGSVRWLQRYNGPGNGEDHANALAIDWMGNVCVTGLSQGSGTERDIATIEYLPNGTQQWVRRYNGPANGVDGGAAIAVDVLRNVYVTGLSMGSGTSIDYATIKYDASGGQQWIGRYNGPANGDDRASAIAVGSAGEVYMTGYSAGIGTFADYTTLRIRQNLVQNSGFESGSANWYFWTNGTGSFSTVSPGAIGTKAGKVTVTTLGSSVQLKQSGISLVSGSQYSLSFRAKSSSGRDMLVGVQKSGSPWTCYGLMGHRVNLSTTWGTFAVRFYADGFTGTMSDATLLFLFGADAASGESYYIDEVVLERVPSALAGVPRVTVQPVGKTVSAGQTAVFTAVATGTPPLYYQWQRKAPNLGHVGEGRDIAGATSPSYTALATSLADDGTEYRCQVRNALGVASTNQAYLTVNHLRNAGFESGTTYWTLYKSSSAGASFTTVTPGAVGTRAGKVSITAFPSGSSVYLKQLGFPLVAGGQYRLTFRAKSSSGRDMTMGVQKDLSPNTCYGLMGYRVNLTTAWATYSVLFNTNGFTGTVTDARFLFTFSADAASGESYYIDEVVLEKLTTAVAGVPKVTTQPISRTAIVGQRATFSVVATGTAPLAYQWQKNGKDIAGATLASYQTPSVTLGDNNAEFRCQVRNSLGVASSNHARLTVTSGFAKEGGEAGDESMPKEYSLLQNYPNPFNPGTTIQYALPEQSHVTIRIYNTLGQEVATLVDEVQPAGYRWVTWDATTFSSGTYFSWMRAGSYSSLKKMLLIK